MTRFVRNNRKKLIRFFILVIFLFSLSIFSIYSLINHLIKEQVDNKSLVTPTVLPTKSVLSSTSNTQIQMENSKPLEEVVQNALVNTKGSYGIVIKNLKTDEGYYFNSNKIYKSGSLYKLWLMGTVYQQLKDGKISDKDILSEEVKVLNKKLDIDPEYAEKKEGKIIFSVKDALEQMIVISDNYAALLLTEKVKVPNLISFLQVNGFNKTKVGLKNEPPVTSPYEVSDFLERIYKGKLIDAKYSNEMLSLLKKQRLNSKIPKYLPSDIVVAHKTGELDEFTHDAGIVYTPNTDYIIVVLSESDSRFQAEERIANVSKAVYEYFIKEDNNGN